MDRNKPVPGVRGPKAKVTQQPPNHFIALGKQSTSRDDSKRTVPLPTTVTSHLSTSSSKAPVDKLKREASSSSLSVPPSKKLKVSIPGARPGIASTSNTGGLQIDRISGSQTGVEPWETLAVDCEATDLFEAVMSSLQSGNTDKAIGIILGVIRAVRSHRSKLCKVVYSSLFLLCSCKPFLYNNENVMMALLSVLRRDLNAGVKGTNKGNSYIHILFINLLSHSFADVVHWPEQFLKLYVEDAVTDRVFIDNPYCKPFVDNIITAFNTKVPPNSLLKSEPWSSAARDTSSPLTIHSVDEDDVFSEHKTVVEQWTTKVFPRYAQAQENVEQIVLEVIKEQLSRRQQPEAITKNFVRFLSTACGLVEIRIIAVSRIETWLHNHKLMKPAQELLAYLCYNCSANSQRDLEVILQLSKLRLKNKPMVSYFNNCLKEMVCAFPENLYPLMKYTIYNELSNARNTNNLIVVGALFQVAQQTSSDAFADIALELLLNKDDYLRSLRALLKEINRVLRSDFNLLTVVQSLLRERKEVAASVREHEFRERIFLSIADLVSMCMLLCVSPQVRDAATQSKRDVAVLRGFQRQVRDIQKECISWLHDSAWRIYRPNVSDFHHVLLKLLFLEQPEHYYKVDSWPGENERNLFLRLASEVPLHQNTLIRILLIGISKEHPIAQTEIMEITDQLIKRAANLPQDYEPPVVVDKIEIMDFFFNLCSYNYPENIALPAGYLPPKLAITGIYWKAWLMLLILSAHNPMNFGSIAWDKYPTLRMFMEMCITNHFSFPPPTMSSLEDDYQVKEQQIIALEKQKILEFESHLAAATSKMEITEQTSLLLPQVMELRPQADARRPPQQVLDQLQVLNNTHRMGHLLCRSRHPDFLLDIMSRQGGTAHMPWLAELVHSSEGVLAHLPVQCLCEYLLSTAPSEKLTKQGQLLAHLRTVVNGPDPQMACEVLEYLFRRLTSDHSASRTQSTKALALILAPSDDMEVSTDNNTHWLTKYMPQFPHFNAIKPVLVQFLRQALQIETNPSRVSSYMNFLSTQDMNDSFPELNELITDLSSVIIERHSVASYVLPGENDETLKNLLNVFLLHTQKSKEHSDETFTFLQSYNAEFVFVHWATGEQCGMQPVVIHSAIVLLTYGPLDDPAYKALLNTWFPDNMDYPRAYSPETSESTSYLPDWMKLRMIRSTVPKLVDAAIEKLEPPKLVLFIQSFGIPTSSISKLLHTLDKATRLNPTLVVDSVIDKLYMIQLVEVQNKRGATGGETFIRAIEMQMPALHDNEVVVDVECKRELPRVQQKQHIVANDNDVLQMLSTLYNPHFNGNRNKVVLSLLKAISHRKPLVDVVFGFLKPVPANFTVPLLLNYSSFSTVLRLIFSPAAAQNKEKITYAQQLLQLIPIKSNASAVVLQQFLNGALRIGVKKEENVDAMELIKHGKLLTAKKCEAVMEFPENLGAKLGKMLLEGKEQAEKTGLVVDWLSAIELEIAHTDKQKIQMDLLFSKQSLPFRPLLMSLVLQRATWKSLHGILTYLLQNTNKEICPTSALDFFTALTQSPKLWQGRDKAIPKHYHFEDVLKLEKSQAMVMISYVLDEARINTDKENWKKSMENRLQLLLKCVGISATSIVKNLSQQADSDVYARELLMMLYMSLPYSGQNDFENTLLMSTEVYNKNCPSAVDEISHCLLSALAATPRTKDWNKKSQDLELCVRKLASSHPVLVLRQLPMLAGSLKGRAQYDWGVFKNRGHFILFGQVLGLMELLQPHIFKHEGVLCDLLDSYFNLMAFHGHSKDLAGYVGRIVVFIQNWLVKDIKAASKYLQEHGGVLNDIQFNQPRVRPLLSNVSLPITDQGLAPSELLVGTVTPPEKEQLPQHWPQLINSLQSTENLNALQELDHLTNKRPQLLEGVSQYLYASITSPNGAIRSLSLTLIVRWLKYNPKSASDALPSVLACLDSNNGDIVSSVLDRLSDLVTVMQEYAKVILTRVFLLGMKSTLNTTTNITKTVNLLSLQYGC
ncbi:unnamed protein product [Brassicogethes aeneus]|uniref:Integrator complex subunit 1 n=1 Tax=Brassicogethes aeneus TaxID=1431903 RepID=A0A9P0FIX4_BRAAE|nr:unnamed protein product [Brassicogethes aeneus]